MGTGTTVMDAPSSANPEVTEGPTDAVLVAAVRRGDDRAFEQLYARYQRRISAYILGMVKDHGRAEDITQEVFIAALRRMRATDRAIAFKPWIYEIAKNACIDQFRRSRRVEEVSMDAREGLGQADHGRLVAGEPTPDDAVHAKQQLDHLCGAFGGLSDSHHEILVLREFEGLSYREIGDRMGLSRPGVESTLFRARKRLTEEYDELVTGQRCVRIQSIIAAAGGSTPGTRDQRRLARHVSHCQPCRRMALASGLDVAALPKTRVRRAAERAASFLPLPGFLRSRALASSESMVPVSEPMAAAWSKAVAIAATVIVAGVGAGVGPEAKQKPPAVKKHERAKPAASRPATVAPPVASSSARQQGASARAQGGGRTVKSKVRRSRERTSSGLGTSHRAAPRRAGSGAPSTPAKATSPSKPAATSPTSSATSPTKNVQAPAAPTPAPPSLPAAPATPPLDAVTGSEVGGQVDQVVQQTTDTVNETVQTVDNTVDSVTGGLPLP